MHRLLANFIAQASPAGDVALPDGVMSGLWSSVGQLGVIGGFLIVTLGVAVIGYARIYRPEAERRQAERAEERKVQIAQVEAQAKATESVQRSIEAASAITASAHAVVSGAQAVVKSAEENATAVRDIAISVERLGNSLSITAQAMEKHAARFMQERN